MILGFDDFELDEERLELRRGGQVIKADALVLKLLAVLLGSAGRLVTKDELVEAVWEGRAVADNVLTVSMARLRKTLEHQRGAREYVATVYGRGYRFVREVQQRAPTSAVASAVQTFAEAPPFVGRERVMTRLRQALAQARAGHGRACVLLGEPGIGKTRVVEMLERELAGTQVGIAWGYCREAGDTPPLLPFLRLLRSATQDDAINASAVDWESSARHRGIDAIVQGLARASERMPWLFVLEDLHNADAASLELLHLLLAEIAHTRILVVATLRHERARFAPRPDTHLPQVLGHRNCERIELERLQAHEVAAYVGALVADPDGSLAKAIFDKSEGNPFFMTELSRTLHDGRQGSAAALAVPDSALELIRGHVARLAPDTRAVLAAAAAIGRSFELPLLAAVTTRDPAALMAELDDAIAADVVVAAPDSVTAFAFGHELLRAVLYDTMTKAEQRQLHARIAHALEQRSQSGDTIAASEMAYHFHAALPHGDLRRTVQHCRAAAFAAGVVFAHSDVVRYIRHALEALDLMEHPSVRLRIALLHGIALYARGHARAEAERALREVIELAREHGDGPALVRAACMLNLMPGFKPTPGATATFEQALALLAPEDDATRSTALAVLACSAPQNYSAERSHELMTEAIALARRDGTAVVLHPVLRCQLYLEGGPGHAGSAAVGDELERIAQQNPQRLPILPVELAMHRAMVAIQHGDREGAHGALDRAVARCRELRLVELLWHGERYRALERIHTGECAGSRAELEALHQIAQQRSIINTEAFCAFDRSVVFAELDAPTADAATERAALAFDAADPPSVWAFKLRALACVGLHDDARSALRRVPAADLARLPSDLDHIGTLAHLARAAVILGEREYIDATYDLLARHPEYFAVQVAFVCDGAVPQLLGMLAHARGERERAVAHFERGIEMNERAGFAPRAQEARLQLARCQQPGPGA